jgi:hypothetical protein
MAFRTAKGANAGGRASDGEAARAEVAPVDGCRSGVTRLLTWPIAVSFPMAGVPAGARGGSAAMAG